MDELTITNGNFDIDLDGEDSEFHTECFKYIATHSFACHF